MTFKKPTGAGLLALALGILFALFLGISVIDHAYAEEAAAAPAAAPAAEPASPPAGARILRTDLLHLTSCYSEDRLQLGALRRNGAAVFTHRARLDHKAVPFQDGAELSVVPRLLWVDPDHQHACGS